MNFPPEAPSNNSAPATAAQSHKNISATDTPAAMTILSPSPTPSAALPLVPSSLLSQTHTEQYGAKTPISGAKNAKDYWERKYRVLELQLQPGKKRKNGSHTEDHDRTKRRHATDGIAIPQIAPSLIKTENADEDEPTVSGAELDSISARGCGLDDIDKNEQMQLLKRNVNLDDPHAVQDLHQLHNSVLSFGDGKCKLVGGKWKLKGFSTSLYHHQAIGVSWMLGRELHPTAPKGGILADDMGLGKTVQVLACMSQNQPAKKSKALKTLIIAPKRLLCQWSNEIIRHCSNTKMGPVFTYAAREAKSNSEWMQGTIILTNYHQLQQQLPSKEKLGQIEQLRSKGNPKWKDLLRQNTFPGSLFGIDWHRVVLDEAHAISNRDSKTSKACRLLIRRCSWILTGTPLANETVELFPYLDFIRTTYNSFGKYQDDIGDLADENRGEKFATIYQEVCLGRQVRDKLMGHPILQIPEDRPTELLELQFSPLECALYKETRDKLHELRELAKASRGTRPDDSSAIQKGELRKLFNYLRFFTSHPALVEPKYLSLEACQARTLQPNGQTPQPGVQAPQIDAQTPQSDIQVPPQGGDRIPVALQYFCRLCCNALIKPLIGNCGHAFCFNCLQRCRKQPRRCLSCDTVPTGAKEGDSACYHHTNDHFEKMMQRFGGLGMTGTTKRNKRVRKPGDDEFGLQPRLARLKPAGKRKGKGKPKKGKGSKSRETKTANDNALEEQIRTHAGNFLRACDKKPWDPIPHSAKTKAASDLVKTWQEEAPDDKIIIFVQWIPVLSFLGRMLFQNGIRFVYLWGELKSGQQEMCIKAFQQDPEIKVMLLSLTCGAYGLNLTAANRAIVFDHWWHEGMERQAFARVYRIGQTKVVQKAKLVVTGSMDETILTMQATKRDTIEAAVGAKNMHPNHSEICDALYQDGQIDEGLLTRLRDLSDDEDDGAEDDCGDSDNESDDDDDDDDDDGGEDGDSNYDDGDDDGDDLNTKAGSDESYHSSGEAHDEGEDAELDPGSDEE